MASTWWLIVDGVTGVPKRASDVPMTRAFDEGEIEVPSTLTFDDFTFARFDLQANRFIFTPHHFVTINRETGKVVGDVISDRPVYGNSKKYAIVDITGRQAPLGDLNGKAWDEKALKFTGDDNDVVVHNKPAADKDVD